VIGAADNGFALSLYGWFCPNCVGQGDAYSTAKGVIEKLKSLYISPGTNYTYFYIDVEECDPSDDCWSKDKETNKQYLVNLVNGAKDGGASVGIYASPYEWNLLFGDTTWNDPAFSGLPIWYPNWNGKADLSGFEPFSGWSSNPHMHQYADHCSVCENVDLDYIE